jgi:hypothetical protein
LTQVRFVREEKVQIPYFTLNRLLNRVVPLTAAERDELVKVLGAKRVAEFFVTALRPSYGEWLRHCSRRAVR